MSYNFIPAKHDRWCFNSLRILSYTIMARNVEIIKIVYLSTSTWLRARMDIKMTWSQNIHKEKFDSPPWDSTLEIALCTFSICISLLWTSALECVLRNEKEVVWVSQNSDREQNENQVFRLISTMDPSLGYFSPSNSFYFYLDLFFKEFISSTHLDGCDVIRSEKVEVTKRVIRIWNKFKAFKCKYWWSGENQKFSLLW